MSSSIPSKDAILATFNNSIQKIEGQPDNSSLRDLKARLKSNAADIVSNQGGGNHGHLGLILTDAAYSTIAPLQPFIVPANPGPLPLIPAGATAAQISQAEREHRANVNEFHTCRNVHDALKHQLLQSVDEMYYRAVKQPHVAYANRSCRTLLQHLFDNYGQVHPIDLDDNTNKMRQAWDPTHPFETVIDQIDNAVDFAESGQQPFTAPQILSVAYTLVFNTGLYTDALDLWDDREAVAKTWENFKAAILLAQRKLNRSRNATAGRHGFGNFANEYPPSLTDENQENLSTAISTLSSAVSADRETFCALVTNNTNLTQQLEETLKRLNALEAVVKKGSSTRSARPPHTENTNYCWTHGYRVAHDHDSKTCKNKADGHKDDAIRKNPLGGSLRGKPADFQ
jgi:regulator of replication initiation timing